MRRYILSKVAQAILTLVFVFVFNFFLFRILPGNPAQTLLRNPRIPVSAVHQLEKDFGLNKPLVAQFGLYMVNTLKGNMGISYTFREPVSTVIARATWPTILLVGTSTIASTLLGLWIGIYAGWKRGSLLDVGGIGFSLVTYAMPEFWLGLVLLVAFAGGAGIFPALFPSGNIQTAGANFTGITHMTDVLNHMFLPFVTLTIAYLGEYALIMRSALLDTLGEEFITTARAKGLRSGLVLRRHVVPNAMLPVITLVVLNLGFVVSGAITIETVFSWPGLGLLSFEALKGPDYPLLEALFLLFSAAVIVANLIGDLMLGYFDPRVRAA